MAEQPPARIQSLRWRLLRTVCIAAMLLWVLTGYLSYQQGREEAEELMDGNLAQDARLLLALVRNNERHLSDLALRLEEVGSEARGVYEPPLEFQIGNAAGEILLRSNNAPQLPILGAPGYIDIDRNGDSWRLLNLVSPQGDYRVQVAQSMALRERAALEVASQTVWPIGLILPVLLLLIYISVRRGLKPLDDLANDVASRSPENLAPVPSDNTPRETRPLVNALNRLLARLGGTLDNERRFTADAAHELRTPLAAVKIQTQVALLSSDPEMRNHALQKIEAGVDRASRLVDQLLRLARLDPLSAPPHRLPVNLLELAEEAVAAIQDSALNHDHEIRIETGVDRTEVYGDRDLLAVALRNLLDNAARYTPAGGTITLTISGERGLALSVRDNGPGVPASELAHLSERFFRAAGGKSEGSGLGLAIVSRIAELHGAQLSLANAPGGGFIARLSWPATMESPGT